MPKCEITSDPVRDADAYMERKDREAIARQNRIDEVAYWLMKDFANPTEYVTKRGYKATNAETTIYNWVNASDEILGKIAQIVAANIEDDAMTGRLVREQIKKMIVAIATDMEDESE